MKLPTWGELWDHHCTARNVRIQASEYALNPFYEDMATRRYNYAASIDRSSFRLVFLKNVLKKPENKTLVRNGRFIWCKDMNYEGRDDAGLRQVSFTVDKGRKRFLVSENNLLCIPAKTFINNNGYIKMKEKTFSAFSSVFSYKNTLNVMYKNSGLDRDEFHELISGDSPYKPGTLVSPRLGYFYPQRSDLMRSDPSRVKNRVDVEHPYGIIIGESFDNSDYSGREFYRVKFGETTYERVHPVQMEVINEV